LKKKVKILFKHDNPFFTKRIDYVLKFIEQHELVREKLSFTRDDHETHSYKLYYGIEQEDAFYIPAQKIIFSDVLPQHNSLKANQYSHSSMQLYALEQKSKKGNDFIINNHFQFDIIETIFFHISRFEEWHNLEGRLDEYGRMDERQHFLVRNHLQRIPVIDHLVLMFLDALGIEHQQIKTKIRITHDIDFIERNNNLFGVIKSMGGAILKRQDFQTALRIWKNRKEKNPFDTFDWMLREENDIEKVIYFLVGGETKFDNPYDLNLPVFKKAIQLSKERGYEIGIHPSYDTWKDEPLMQQEREKLERSIGENISLTRQHFLRFSFKDTPRIIQKLGFKEDSSLGFANRIGFRCGTGFSYQLYDFENECAFDFMETPLVFMDSALFAEANHQPDLFKKIWKEFLAENQFNTRITFNFHNSRFYDASLYDIPLKELYLEIFKADH
jgi:uncharacterized protein DUF7033